MVWASGPRFVGWACPRLRFRPEGPFSVSPGRSPGWQGPQKSWFLGLKGRFQGVCCFRLRARGFQTLTRLALPKPVLQACGRGGACAPSRSHVWFMFCQRLRSRPETPFSSSLGRSHCHAPFCRGHGSKDCAAPSPPIGPTAIHNLATSNARGTWIKAHKAVPEFTANAFANHHRRIRLASLCEPKTMNSLRCSDGMPSTTPHFVGNDKALAPATFAIHSSLRPPIDPLKTEH